MTMAIAVGRQWATGVGLPRCQNIARKIAEVFNPLVTGDALMFDDNDNSGWLAWVA